MKFLQNVKLLILLVFILIPLNTAMGWDEVGHKLTAYIAWQQMTPEVREKVFQIIMKAPEDSDLNTPYDAFNSRTPATKKLELFMYASIWPDVIRNRAFEVRYNKYNRSNWHYGKIFWKQEQGNAFKIDDFPVESGLAVEKLKDFERTLKDSSAGDAEKSVAIAWLLHVGGDLHNPLHNASRVTATEPEGDQGGNLFILKPRSEGDFGVNLHSYWDSIIGTVKSRKNDACDLEYLEPIARKIMKKYKLREMSARLRLSEYTQWNEEGYALLDTHVYTDGLTRGTMPSQKYKKRAYRTAREQIALAGYRLGETFNMIFGSKHGV